MKAAIDCGTNSFRLLIVDEHLQPVVQELRITRIGEGVHGTRRISDAAIARSTDALHYFATLLGKYDVGPNVRAVATSAARDVTNGEEFLESARHALGGIEVEILTGEQEGTLTFQGVAAGIQAAGPMLVVDIGGGSTELAYGCDGKLEWARSLDVGCVRLTETHLHSDPYKESELSSAAAVVKDLLTPVEISKLPGGCRLVGVAGSTTSIAAIAKHIDQYTPDCVHGQLLSFDELEKITRRLEGMTNNQRMAIAALPPGRADVIVAGALILEKVMTSGAFETCLISERDLLYGLVI